MLTMMSKPRQHESDVHHPGVKQAASAENHECEQCGKSFKQTYLLKQHVKTVHGVRRSHCDQCEYKCTFSYALLLHKARKHHGDYERFNLRRHDDLPLIIGAAGGRKQRPRRQHLCEICDAVFSTGDHLRSHERRIHPVVKENHDCTQCGKSFKTGEGLKRHENNVHGERRVHCDVCEFKCQRASVMQRHKAKHTDEYTSECSVCARMFKTKTECTVHVKAVHNERLYNCEICEKQCQTSGNLRNHFLVAHGERNGDNAIRTNFECDSCGQVFTSTIGLKEHKKYQHNSGTIAKLKCNECLKMFVKQQTLKTHIAGVHGNNKRPFSCDVCQKSFKTNSTLFSHRKTHQTKSFHCKNCTQSFVELANLKRHERTTHLSPETFECDQCHKQYTSLQNLKLHKNVKHSDQPIERK